MSHTIQVFLLILVASFVFTTLLSRIPLLRIPSAVSYLLFGILLHVGVIRLNNDEMRWLSELGDFGLLFLMFLSGMEVDVGMLRPEAWRSSRVNPLYAATSLFCLTLLTSFGLSVWLVHQFGEYAHPWMLTLLFATTSLGVIVPILEEADVLRSDFGQTLLLSALMADLCTMLLISLFISAQSSGRVEEFLATFIVIPLAALVYALVQRARRSPILRRYAGDIPNRMRAVVALVAGFCAVAEFTGSEPIIGSFLAGILIGGIPMAYKRKLRDFCHGLGYGFLIPVFFISVGLNFDLEHFRQPSSWKWIPVLLMVAFLVKMIPAWQLRRYFGTRAAVAAGILLSARLSLIVAAADIGVRMGFLPQFIAESIVLVAVCTCLLAPIAFVALI